MGSFAVRLSETASSWGRAVAPFAEMVARELWSMIAKPERIAAPTRLTQTRKREAKGNPQTLPKERAATPQRICGTCGAGVNPGHKLCKACAAITAKENLLKAAYAGRIAGQSVEAQIRRSETQRRNAASRYGWSPSSQPAWLTEETYSLQIQPLLPSVARAANCIILRRVTGLCCSHSYGSTPSSSATLAGACATCRLSAQPSRG